MKFNRVYVSAVVEHDGNCATFDDLNDVGPDTIARFQVEFGIKIFWSIYGVDEDSLSVCIGDFKSRKAADEIAEAIRGVPY